MTGIKYGLMRPYISFKNRLIQRMADKLLFFFRQHSRNGQKLGIATVKTLLYICCIALFPLIVKPMPVLAGLQQTQGSTRDIHVVFDDSGSMIVTDGKLVDTWCQAKYAMEVFAAMLGEKDTMDIYYMSDFDNGVMDAKPKISLTGSDGQNFNVSQIHNTISTAKNTPFDTVRKAYADLESSDAQERWLVVLTDGEFQGIQNIDSFFASKKDEVKVMFLGMGAKADEIKQDDERGIYFAKAENNRDILNKITDICTRIFNSDRLEVNTSAKTISFDVPMSELTVFAQGANVSIKEIKDSGGKTYAYSTEPVNVKYSEKAADNHNEFIMAEGLKGKIVSFKDDFNPGSYSLDIAGADTIEVYYKPNIEPAVYLVDEAGKETDFTKPLKAGEYTLKLGLVKAGTLDKVGPSSLLGDVSYLAEMSVDGKTYKEFFDGDKLYLDEGKLEITAIARYLGYHAVSAQFDCQIYEDKEIGLSVMQNPEYKVADGSVDFTEPIKIKAVYEGKDVTDGQWANMVLPEIILKERGEKKQYGACMVEKSETPGVFNLYFSLEGDELDSGVYQDCDFTVLYDGKEGESAWRGQTASIMKIQDERTWIERYLRKLIRYTGIALVFLFILGYFPPFKKYLPRLSEPVITYDLNMRKKTDIGEYTISPITTILPYVAEKGTLRFVPNISGAPPEMRVKAVKKNRFLISNINDYRQNNSIKIGKQPITQLREIGTNSMFETKIRDTTYKCNLKK